MFALDMFDIKHAVVIHLFLCSLCLTLACNAFSCFELFACVRERERDGERDTGCEKNDHAASVA